MKWRIKVEVDEGKHWDMCLSVTGCWQDWQNTNFLAYEHRNQAQACTHAYRHICIHSHAHTHSMVWIRLPPLPIFLHSSLKQLEWSGEEKWQLFMSSLSNKHWLEEIGSSGENSIILTSYLVALESHLYVCHLQRVCMSTSGGGGAEGRKIISFMI